MKSSWRVVVAISLLLVGCEKARLDEEVRRLCEKDGGAKVYERVRLPLEQFDRFGEIKISEKRLAAPNDDFFFVWESTVIRKGNPSLKRNHFKLYRRADKKLLAEGVGYVRSGGDAPGPWHESAFHCPDPSRYSVKFLSKEVFMPTDARENRK